MAAKMKKLGTIKPLSADALGHICRALSDAMENYGWNVYYDGAEIPPLRLQELAAEDDNILPLVEALDAARLAYEDAAGEPWRY
jgi:hypothetical protein